MSIAPKVRRSVGIAPEFALLGFLYLEPSHGYDLHQQLSRELGYIWNGSQSETYNILKRLQERGFIKSRLVTQEKLPARNMLFLTPSGRKRFEAWLKTPGGSGVRTIRLEFATRLYFAGQTRILDQQQMIDQQVAEVRASLRKLEGDLIELPLGETYNRLGLEYQILQRKSILDWLDSCRQTLNLQFYPDDALETLFEKEEDMKLSARNILKGRVVKVTKGAVNTEVTLQLEGGEQIVSIITNTSAENLKLKEGGIAYAIIKASNVMMGVDEK
ncbi:MAG TPA: TOBE domain-containing protein [Anaerolineales bacterium]|nr:TOBE domain-containing protein [Anaerolineales bacterium]